MGHLARGGATGRWVFRNRSWLPVPLVLILLVAGPSGTGSRGLQLAGGVSIVLGQSLRLWAVRHIGVISRTRTTRLGPLITTGPYAWSRNPLYVANWLLWTGFVLAAQVLWMLPVAWAVFALQYRAIVKWEEQLLRERYPDAYDEYAARVRRWWPSRADRTAMPVRIHPWQDVLFSERGTLAAIVVLATLLLVREVVT